MKLVLIVFITVLYWSFIIGHLSLIHASYVLPYPSYMPGNKMYKISRTIDQIKKYWYWGNIAQTKYHLSLSDKYLVEAKTLFEYQQYLLAIDALHRSDLAMQQLTGSIHRAEKEFNNMKVYRQIITDEIASHQIVLNKLTDELPSEFLWQPEKKTPQLLRIGQELKNSQALRTDISNRIQNE